MLACTIGRNPYIPAMTITSSLLNFVAGSRTVHELYVLDPKVSSLAPGQVIVPIRSIGPRERSRVRRHLLGLNPSDRYLRFGYAASDEQVNKYVDGLDFERDELFGIYNRRLDLIAIAHLAFAPPTNIAIVPNLAFRCQQALVAEVMAHVCSIVLSSLRVMKVLA
jgi:hypothetical protein